jgi:hypothetical protein
MANLKQMQQYWETRPAVTAETSVLAEPRSSLTGFDEHRKLLLGRGEEGWVEELGRYLGDLPQDATPDMDVVKYWQVSDLRSPLSLLLI